MKFIKKSFVIMILISLIFPFNAHSGVYKCMDKNGKIVFKNSACSEEEKSETMIKTDRSDTEYGKDYYYENEDYSQLNENKRKVADVKKISSGERVNLNRYVVEDQVTAFLFYADWCAACERIRPGIEKLAKTSDNLVLRKIDITAFESPVTEQYKIKAIPYFYIYDKSGKLALRGSRSSALNYLNNNI